jgi:Na+/H+ antiporter NhaD/arsenite permease-like protein
MDLAAVCLVVLVAVLAVSCVTSLNVGLAAMAAAWVVGVYVAPWYEAPLGIKVVTGGFPVDLFLNLAGTTLLFAAAQTNGTLKILVERCVAFCGGRAWSMPPVFFVLAFALAAAGPGNIAASALLAPSALALAARLKIPPLVMIIAVAHGSIAGGTSPLTPIGLVVADNYRKHGLEAALTETFLYNGAINTLLAIVGALVFGGVRWMTNADREEPARDEPIASFAPRHVLTCVVVGVVVAAALATKNLHLGLAAFTGSAVLLLSRSADERESIRAMPWNVILMVCGVSLLIALCEKTGAVDLLSRFMRYIADEGTVAAWSAFVTGLISIFSSTSGVVLPTFLPAVGDIVREVGGGNPASVATAIVIGSNAVDVSPLSTIGALCIAAAGDRWPTRPLFNRMLLWGFLMAPLTAIVCQLMLR